MRRNLLIYVSLEWWKPKRYCNLIDFKICNSIVQKFFLCANAEHILNFGHGINGQPDAMGIAKRKFGI